MRVFEKKKSVRFGNRHYEWNEMEGSNPILLRDCFDIILILFRIISRSDVSITLVKFVSKLGIKKAPQRYRYGALYI